MKVHLGRQAAHNRLGGMMWPCGTHRSGGATSVELRIQLGRITAAVPVVHATPSP